MYAIPGLSTDYRIFDKLKIGSLTVLPWLLPEKEESIQEYGQRLGASIPEEEEITLVGFSLGGLLAQVLSQTKNVKQLILISTICHDMEKPFWFPFFKVFPVYKWVEGQSWRNNTFSYIAPLIGVHDKPFSSLMEEMIHDFPPSLRTWAIEQVLYWQGVPTLPPTLRLHGTKDQLFPANSIKSGEKIAGGDHFMLYLKADIISQHIRETLSKDSSNKQE